MGEFYEPHPDFVYPDDPEENEGRENKVLEKILDWLFPPRAKPSVVLVRAFVLAWFIRPEWLGLGAGRNQNELAKKLDISKAALGWHVRAFRETFGFKVGGLRSDECRAKNAEVAKRNAVLLAAARRNAANRRAAAKIVERPRMVSRQKPRMGLSVGQKPGL